MKKSWRNANYDELTGLLNRRMFQSVLEQEALKFKRTGKSLALFLLDLDNFKEINDSLGHDIGDIVLRETAIRINGCLRDTDTVARLGGDEFTIILSELDNSYDADSIAQKIIHSLSLPFELNHHRRNISASIGISIYPNDTDDIDLLMRQADQAMYDAKKHGRNCFSYFTPSLQAAANQRLDLCNDLQLAIERDEFDLYYQPQIDMATGKISGVEALIRWQHPVKGLCAPDYFMDAAEDTGLIIPIGDWVIRSACNQVKSWDEQGVNNMSVTINLSAKQFHTKDLPQKIKDILSETGLQPALLELEISENIIMNNPDEDIDQLIKLKDIGIMLAIDNFGTGHTSFTDIKDYPINRLKLDSSFVINVDTEPKDSAIVTSTIALAHELGINTMAEGVETQAQVEYLMKQNCDNIQGYYFCKPLPADQAENFIKTHL